MVLNSTAKKASILMLIFCFVLVSAISGCRKSSPSKETSSGTNSTATEEKTPGKTHNLSDYKGKDVLVVLWATWCQPCILEIPHLTALRDIMGEDKLSILAISNEPAELVKAMAKKKDINYTVVSYQGVLPEPFNRIRGIPSAFFIRPDGTLKLVVEGGAHLGEMKSIILAE